MTYLADVNTQLWEVEKNIIAAENHIRLEQDVAYRKGVLSSLYTQRTAVELLQEKLLVAVNDFELDLFRQIHALVRFQLKGDREKVFAKEEEAKQAMQYAKKTGNIDTLIKEIQIIEYYQKRIALLDRIQFSASFEEMMPFLKEYLNLGGLQLSAAWTSTSTQNIQ